MAQKYTRKPEPVEAMQRTLKNTQEVIGWINSKVDVESFGVAAKPHTEEDSRYGRVIELYAYGDNGHDHVRVSDYVAYDMCRRTFRRWSSSEFENKYQIVQ
jgi:hypothetical protein